MELSYAMISVCLIDATLGIHNIQRRDIQVTSQSTCSVTTTLLDILKNDLRDLRQNNEKLEDKYDDKLKRLEDRCDNMLGLLKNDLEYLKQNNKNLESRCDDLVDKYSKLLQATTTLQVNFANYTVDNQVASGRDCADLYKNGVKLNGVYTITPYNSPSAFNVYCDMTTDGGGWTVFQKRMDGSVDFYRGWQSYKHGFGNLNGEHWLGNDFINAITNQRRYELRVDLEDANGVRRYASYDHFAIASERAKYKLILGNYSGNAGDSLSTHNGYAFTTKDRDNDVYRTNCAQAFKGAWWYNNCHASNLNGLYHLGFYSPKSTGIDWFHFRGHYHSMKTTEMKVRPVDFKTTSSGSG